MDQPACRLYLITPPGLPDLDGFAGRLEAALDAGDVAALQIRLKEVDDETVARAVDALAPLAQPRGGGGDPERPSGPRRHARLRRRARGPAGRQL